MQAEQGEGEAPAEPLLLRVAVGSRLRLRGVCIVYKIKVGLGTPGKVKKDEKGEIR